MERPYREATQVRVGSLFTGIGGFDLAAQWMGWRTEWMSEIDPYACRVLEKHWPNVPNLGDITTIDFHHVSPIDVLVGGFPCQDISNAGKQAGITGTQSGLWTYFAEAIRIIRPRYIVVENVAALLSRGIDTVLGDLAAAGYNAAWRVCEGTEVGSPQQRPRLFLAAWREWEPVYELDDFAQCESCDDWFCPRCDCHAGDCPCITAGRVACEDDFELADEPWGYVAYPSSQRRCRWESPWEYAVHADSCREVVLADGDRTGWATGPSICGVAYGVPSRLDRLRGLGNAIIPHHALHVYQWIAAREDAICQH